MFSTDAKATPPVRAVSNVRSAAYRTPSAEKRIRPPWVRWRQELQDRDRDREYGRHDERLLEAVGDPLAALVHAGANSSRPLAFLLATVGLSKLQRRGRPA
jgi:hypothetical protein